MPSNKRKETTGPRPNRQLVKSDGLVERKVEGERNQDEDAGPSPPSSSRRQVSTVSRSSVSDIEIGPGSGTIQLHEEELEQIFGLLTFADVKSARLVNKHWRQAATTLIRRSSKEIELNRSIANCITKMGDGQFPVNRLQFCPFVDDYYGFGHTKICLASFPGICAWVKELTISVHISNLVLDYMVTFPTDCVYEDLTHFSLDVNQWTDLFRESWERFTDFVGSILENSPNLREVKVDYNSSWTEHAEKLEICPVIENLFPISNSVVTSKLCSINFERVPLEKIDLAKWSTLKLKLRKLGLKVSRFNKSNELLSKFLETQTGTLKQLTLKLSGKDTAAPAATFAFPRLEKLEQLRVTCNGKYAPATFADIDYARMFPCLKKLDLEEDYANWRDFLGNDLLQPTNTVEELSFPWLLGYGIDGDLTPNPVVTAAKLFTGLKKLEIYANHDFTEAVYENMPNLEVLTFSNSSFGTYDDIITGLGLDVCRKFRGVMTRRWAKKINAALRNAEGRSMTRLQNLKTLKLSKRISLYPFFISRLSLHVFKKMRSLKCLDLFHGCGESAERYSADEEVEQFLEELRANFVVL